MTELIDKNEFIKEIEAIKFSEDAKKMNVTYDANMDGFFKGLVEGMVGFMPTTTEAEIRNKAYTEFAEKLNAKIEEVYSATERESEYNHAWKTVCRIIQGNMEVIAEQLKEE